MKTALCLYGQPREISNTWSRIYNNIVEPNAADVFFHTWYDPDDLRMNKMTPGHEGRTFSFGLDRSLPEALKPKRFEIQKQLQFHHKNFEASDKNIELCWPWSKVYDRKLFIQDRSRAQFSMWFSIMNSLMCKDLYSHENGFIYDCVILSRFDVAPHLKMDSSSYDLDSLNFQDLNKERGEITDWFMFSSSEVMNIVGSVYMAIDFHYRNSKLSDDVWTNESFLSDHMKTFGIKTSPVDLQVTF